MSGEAPSAIVIGSSAGAVQALSEILPRLPAEFPLPILVVVHVPAAPSGLTTLFSAKCAMAVVEPDDKEAILPGTVYFAPPGYHLLVEPGASISLSADDPVLFSRPSIDVLFESAAAASPCRSTLTKKGPIWSRSPSASVSASSVGMSRPLLASCDPLSRISGQLP